MVNEAQNLGDAAVDRETEQGLNLPPMPNPPPSFQIEVKAELLSDFEHYSTGQMLLHEHSADVSLGDEKIGRVAYGWGGVVMVTIGRRNYWVKFGDIFNAIYEAEQSK